MNKNKPSEEIIVTEIPFPALLLQGDWTGVVYSISTTWASIDRHHEIVEEKIKEIIKGFDKKSHWSVSLRLVKKEMVVAFDETDCYLTLAQFRVRDAY